MSRVANLDYIKGIGCFVMVPGHTLVLNVDDKASYYIYVLLHFFTCLFFTASGVTTLFQADRRPLPYLLAYFLILFFVGLTFTSIWHPQWLFDFRLEIVQVIMLGCISLLLMHRIFKDRWGLYFFASMAIFLVKVARDTWFPEWTGGNILFPHADYVPSHLREEGDPLVTVGFPLFPWLFLFPLGVFCYFGKLKWNYLIAGSCMVAAIFMYLQYGIVDFYDKWDMSIEHFLVVTFITSVTFIIARSVPSERLPLRKVATFYGQSSLTFLYMHLIVLNLIGVALTLVASKETPYIQYVWYVLSYIGVYFAMKWIAGVRTSTWMKKESAWIILLAVVFAMPLITLYNENLKIIVSISGLLIGLFMAHNYKSIKDFPSLQKLLNTNR